ncbi:MAG: amidase [Pseudorhodoplanes sp.]|uniref:amidase n=1 Tax=Pseudorhodoplanes sp. TaxID=1934341 RepID=UPI003D0C2D82
MSENLERLSLVEVADALRRGDVTSVAVTEHALERLNRLGPVYNCTMTIETERALDRARRLDEARGKGVPTGLLHGVPLAHKDLFYRSGRRVTLGSPIHKDEIARSTATVLERLDAAGAIDAGTLQMSEFAYSPTGYNRHFGHCRNPWNIDHVPGGSSSGSGAAVAGRLVYGALGTDSGGSARHPAALCGVTGLKPTQTRVSRSGVGPLSFSLDCVSPLARTARDCARLLAVIAGPDDQDSTSSREPVERYEEALTGDIRGISVAIPRGYYDEVVTGEVAEIVANAAAVLRDLGAVTRETGCTDMALVNGLAQAVMAVEAATVHRKWLTTRRDDYADVVRSRIEPGLFIPATRYCEALSMRATITRDYLDTTFGDADVAMTPAIPIAVPSIAETTTDDPAKVAQRLGALTHCTRGINYLGLPAIVVPAGFTDNGMPCAFQLIGRPFGEATLLKIADAFQGVTDWHRRIPPTA